MGFEPVPRRRLSNFHAGADSEGSLMPQAAVQMLYSAAAPWQTDHIAEVEASPLQCPQRSGTANCPMPRAPTAVPRRSSSKHATISRPTATGSERAPTKRLPSAAFRRDIAVVPLPSPSLPTDSLPKCPRAAKRGGIGSTDWQLQSCLRDFNKLAPSGET